jgi:integrase/recombinase XerD
MDESWFFYLLIKFAIKDFLDEREFRQVSKNTLTNYQVLLKDFHTYCIENEVIDVMDVTPKTIKSYLQFCLKDKHNSPVSINTKLTALKTMFNYLQEIETITAKQNPTKKIGYVKTEVKITTFTDSQIREILNYYRRIKTKDKTYFAYRDTIIVTFLLSTGCRLGEMCNLKWIDIDLISKHIIIFGKLRVQQGIPVAEPLKKELQEYRIYCEREFKILPEYVFVNRKAERLTENAVQNIFKRLKQVMQFKNVRCCAHDFRRYFAKTLILQGADAFTVQRLLRHSKLDMTLKYVSLYGQDLDKRNEQWNPLHKFDL